MFKNSSISICTLDDTVVYFTGNDTSTIKGALQEDLGRFPFNRKYRFEFSVFPLSEWNGPFSIFESNHVLRIGFGLGVERAAGNDTLSKLKVVETPANLKESQRSAKLKSSRKLEYR